MNRRMYIWIFAILFSAVGAGAFIAVRQADKPISTASRADSTFLPTIPPVAKKATPKEATLKEYSDPTGFRFLYPSSVSLVSEIDDADSDLYASIKLKPHNGGGYISFKITTSNFTKIDEWLKANGLSKNAPGVEKIKLADLDAYQTTIQNQKITGALDTGTIITLINTDPNNSDLSKAYDSVVETFAFYQPEGTDSTEAAAPANTAPAAESSDEIVESDEVIE